MTKKYYPNAKARQSRILAAVLSVFLFASFAGCSQQPKENAEKPVVLTTFTVLSDIAKNVAGDRLDVQSITKVGTEIHGYQPTPQDIAKASKASLIVENGLNLEAWFEKFIEQADAPRVVISDGVDPVNISSDSYAGLPNPHAWMSPTNVIIYVDNLVDAFTELDPAGGSEFKKNAESYKSELLEIQQRLVSSLEKVPAEQRVLVTCEGAFSYLARDAGLEEVYIWPVNAENQATPQQIATVIEAVKEKNVPAVFCESTVSDGPMQQVVTATNADFGGVLYVDSLSEENGPVPTYLELISHDVDQIISGLTK